MISSLFLALPLPLKIAFIVAGGLFWGVQVKRMDVQRDVQKRVPAAQEQQAQPAVPKPVQQGAKPVQALEVTVNADGSYQYGGEKLTGQELSKKLKAVATQNPQRRVVIKADSLTPHQMIANAVKLSKGAGLINVSFTSKPSAP